MIAPRNIPDVGKSRRKKLSSLSQEIDDASRADRQACLRALLRSPLIISTTENAELYARIRRHAEWLKNWFAHFPSWSLHITSEAARLNKTPANAVDSTRPCRDSRTSTAFTKRRYVLLCLCFSSLERAQRQTTLGHLAKDVIALINGDERFAFQGIRFSLESVDERRDFVQVLRKLIEFSVLERIHGNEEHFVQNEDSDALYNVHHSILGRLLTARQAPSLLINTAKEERLHALLAEPVADSDEARNRAIRIKFYRLLLDDPVVYHEQLSLEEITYWEKQRPFIVREIEEQTGLVAEPRAEGIAMVDPIGDLTDLGLPEEGTDGHLTLLIAEFLAKKLRKSKQVQIPTTTLYAHTTRLINEHKQHWRKSVTEPGMNKSLCNNVLIRLEGLGLIRRQSDSIEPLPTVARYGLQGVREI